ncbi:hypothetical protein ACLB2K_062506 [Fragaria x ananassa]
MTDVTGSPMYQVAEKIRYTRLKLDAWQKNIFRDRQMEMMGIRSRLEELMDVGISGDVVEEKNRLSSRLHSLLSQEETFWRQRAKVTWLRDGDRNTTYFHHKASNRKRKNNIKGLYDECGMWVEDDEGVEKIVSSYFSCMFTAEDVDMEAMNSTLAAIEPCVTREMNEQLCSYLQDEIQSALLHMYPTKSPGPDANRLKLLLPEVISPYQSAFVPGRLITDNILVANELAHFVHNKKGGEEGYIVLKLDLSKAYGKMEWLFLRKVLERLGFAAGDPLSPYLFLLGAEGFSALLRRKQKLGWLPGLEICAEAPQVNHLVFADDSMLYANASLADCYHIQDVIEIYGRASGQLVNFAKSSIVFSKNVSEFMQEEISSLLGMEVFTPKLIFYWTVNVK